MTTSISRKIKTAGARMENDETEQERDASLPFFKRLEGN
jgi:hypothetical protein